MTQLELFDTTNTNSILAMPRRATMLEKYSTQTLYDAAMLMQDIGGSFASTIAQAYFHADSTNREKLLEAFSHLFESYIPRKLKAVE